MELSESDLTWPKVAAASKANNGLKEPSGPPAAYDDR